MKRIPRPGQGPPERSAVPSSHQIVYARNSRRSIADCRCAQGIKNR